MIELGISGAYGTVWVALGADAVGTPLPPKTDTDTADEVGTALGVVMPFVPLGAEKLALTVEVDTLASVTDAAPRLPIPSIDAMKLLWGRGAGAQTVKPASNTAQVTDERKRLIADIGK